MGFSQLRALLGWKGLGDYMSTQSNTERRQVPWYGITAAAVMVVLGTIGLVSCNNDGNSSLNSVPPSTVQAAPADCPNGYPLAFNPEGELPDQQFLPDKPGSTHAFDTRDELIAGIKENPRTLAAWVNKLFPKEWSDSKVWRPLATSDLKCLSDEGVIKFTLVKGALTANTTKVDENAIADDDMVNSALTADGPVSNPTAGITGDRSAIVFTFGDGTKITVLKRCANFAEEKPYFPPSPTHKPPTVATQPPIATTPPTTVVPPTTEAPPTTVVPSTAKVETPNPSAPPGIVPLPVYGPVETAPPVISNPAPPPAAMPTDAPVTIVPVPSTYNPPPVPVELPQANETQTEIIADPDSN